MFICGGSVVDMKEVSLRMEKPHIILYLDIQPKQACGGVVVVVATFSRSDMHFELQLINEISQQSYQFVTGFA